MSILSPHPGAAVTQMMSPGRLLAPERRVVPFVGRTAELSALVEWCTGPQNVAVRLVSGPRGVGKTRLAREAAQHMARAGWTCLDVPDGAEAAALAAVPDGAPGLLVLDRAAQRGTALTDLLRAAAQGRNGALRILLVARDAGRWFDRLAASDVAVRALLEPARAEADLEVEVIAGQVDARLVAAFVEPYAAALGLQAPRVAVASVPGGGAVMLDLQAAALCAVLRAQARQPQGVLPVDVSDALDELLEHERWSWFRSAELAGVLGETGFLPHVMDPLVAAATLTGIRTPDAAQHLVRRVAAVVQGVRPGAEADIGRWLLELEPQRVLPELLVDPHLLAELTDTPELVGVCLGDTGVLTSRRAALRAVEIVTDRLDGQPDDVGPAVDRLGAVIAALPADLDTLRAVLGVLPTPSLALGELRAEVALRALAATPHGDPAQRAEALHDVGTALAEVGRPADAEPHARAALALFRELVAADPGRYRQRLAAQLAHLGAVCTAQGLAEDATACAAEAVEVLRAVSPDQADVVRLDLAVAVSTLAASRPVTVRTEQGHAAGDLGPHAEAEARWRRLARGNPHRFGEGHARALATGARYLLGLGRGAEALEPAAESVRLRRRLAATRPDEHLPGLGDALGVMGLVLADQGRCEESLGYVEESVQVHRRTARDQPGRYLPDLAGSLQSLGARLGELWRHDEALDLQQEAVGVWRRLVAEDPRRYEPGLAGALSELGLTLSHRDRSLAALDAVREAIRTWRELGRSEPRSRPQLARSLTNLSSIFAALRLGDEAVAPATEAAEILRELATEDPAYRPWLAEALRALALALHDLERFAEARLARAEVEDLGVVTAPCG